MFGSCKVCLEKDKRIIDLQAEVVYLRALASPSQLTIQIPDVTAEANAILDGGPSHQPLTDEEAALEAEAILSGSY